MKSPPRALIFDVFGTIVDWRNSIAREASLWFDKKSIPYDSLEFADLWRQEYVPAMARIRSGNRGYVPLDVLHRENLDRVLEKTGLASKFDETERAELNKAWERLDPWPDSVEGLKLLKNNFIIAPCSNGSIALMTRLAKFGNLPWDCILGAEIAQNYKPNREVYLACCKALQLKPEEVMMVAAHNDDLAAARASGLQTGFILRPKEHGDAQTTDLAPAQQWDMVENSLINLAQALA